ncbi:hypothetical protein Tco_1142348 [Tanacetum coccineum]
MCTYLKNMEGYKIKDLKLKEFDYIQEMFDRAFKRVNTFEDFRTELVEGKEKRAGTEMLKFNSIKDAKKLLEAVEKRFGRNATTRKTQMNLLKQQYENFTAPSSEMLDQTFDRIQKLRNKADLDTMSIDDVCNNLKVYEPEVKGMSSSSSSTQNMAFVSSSNNNTSSTNEAVNTTHGVSTASTQVNDAKSTNIDNLSDVVICAFFTSQPNSPQLVHAYLQQIHLDDMEEMDLRWQMVMLTMRERRFLKNTGRKLISSKKSRQQEQGKLRRSVHVETSTSTALVSCDGLGGYDWSNQAEEGLNYALMAFSSSSLDSEVSNDSICLESVEEKLEVYKANEFIYLQDIKGLKFEIHIGEITIKELRKKLEIVQKEKDGIQLNVDKFEHASKRNFISPTPDLSFIAMSSKEEPKVVRKCNDAPSIEEWVSDDEEEDVSQQIASSLPISITISRSYQLTTVTILVVPATDDSPAVPRNDNPYYQAPKSHKSYEPPSKQSSSTRSHATTKYKGKEIAKPITPTSESALEEDSDPEEAQRDNDMQKNLALIAYYFKKIYKPTNNNLRTSSNSRNKNVDTSPRYKNDNHTREFGNQRTMTVAGARETVGSQECRKPKRVKDYTYHKEKMLLCKQAEKGVPLQAEQADWLADTNEQIDEQEFEAHYSYMEKIQEVPTADSKTDTEPLEQIV